MKKYDILNWDNLVKITKGNVPNKFNKDLAFVTSSELKELDNILNKYGKTTDMLNHDFPIFIIVDKEQS